MDRLVYTDEYLLTTLYSRILVWGTQGISPPEGAVKFPAL